MSLYETSEPQSGAILDPRAKIQTILLEAHKMKLHIKYQRPGLYSFRQNNLKVFPYRSLCKTSDPWGTGAFLTPWL